MFTTWSRDVPAFLGTSQATGMYSFMVRIKARDKVSPLIAKTKKKVAHQLSLDVAATQGSSSDGLKTSVLFLPHYFFPS